MYDFHTRPEQSADQKKAKKYVIVQIETPTKLMIILNERPQILIYLGKFLGMSENSWKI